MEELFFVKIIYESNHKNKFNNQSIIRERVEGKNLSSSYDMLNHFSGFKSI